jgi:hypothetical protein
MENWGLVLYRETDLLAGNASGIEQRRDVALTVAHELAHMVRALAAADRAGRACRGRSGPGVPCKLGRVVHEEYWTTTSGGPPRSRSRTGRRARCASLQIAPAAAALLDAWRKAAQGSAHRA